MCLKPDGAQSKCSVTLDYSWTKIAASHLSYKIGSHGKKNVNGNRDIIKMDIVKIINFTYTSKT